MQPDMKLHWSPRSPYVRKVMITAHEAGVIGWIRTVRTLVGGTTPNRALMHDNPLGKIPTLILQDGTALYNSRAICEYLDSLNQGPKLFPPWPQRATALRRLALGDGMLDVALAWIGERRRLLPRQSHDHIALWQEKIIACIDALELEAGLLASDPFSVGHIAIGVALGYLDLRFPDLSWRDGHPRLASWHVAFEARESARAAKTVDDL